MKSLLSKIDATDNIECHLGSTSLEFLTLNCCLQRIYIVCAKVFNSIRKHINSYCIGWVILITIVQNLAKIY